MLVLKELTSLHGANKFLKITQEILYYLYIILLFYIIILHITPMVSSINVV